jgi:hypothetical protein
MSEYQRYEFMTVDRPLTREQLDAVNDLSSHIEASSTHAIIEYHWGDFKHDPIEVLYEFFDGFLYWANWGSPQFALRFPHGALPADLVEYYDFDEFVTFTQHPDYDILDIHFGEWEALDEWVDYDLASLIGVREELMEGDLRPLYIAWLACQSTIEGYYDNEEEEEEGEEEEDRSEDDELRGVMPVPPGFGELTAAEQALAELLRLPEELLMAAAQYSNAAKPTTADDFPAWVERLSQERLKDYLVRLAHNEPGLSRLLVKELRELGWGGTDVAPLEGKRVTYATLLAESKGIKERLAREKRERERRARLQHLQEVHDNKYTYWHRVDQEASRGNASGYDEAVKLLVELRDAANQFKETQDFRTRFQTWLGPHMRRPALIRRLRERSFTLPEA